MPHPDKGLEQPSPLIVEGPSAQPFAPALPTTTWPIAGGRLCVINAQIWPVFWIAAEDRPVGMACSHSSREQAEPPLPTLSSAWDTSNTEPGRGPQWARLTVWVRPPTGPEHTFRLWWDTRIYQRLLTTVIGCQRMLVAATAPAATTFHSLRDPQLPPSLVVTFNDELDTLITLLDPTPLIAQ